MGKTIEERVVQMEFDNKSFESNAKTTMSTLEKLKSVLNFDGATKGFDSIDKAVKGLSFGTVTDGLDSMRVKFSALGVMGVTVLQDLTRSALSFGKKIAGAVLDPIIEGGARRAQNIENAKFQLEGLGMDVEKAMAAANYAVTDTAYGLDVAAMAAAQFGASGMEAGDDMATALRAISGVAAMTNSSYEDMSNIFTTVAGNGRLMGDQLRQLSSRGMNAAATLAKAMGKTEAEIRDMVSKGKISFEDFYKAMDAAFGEHATKANETYAGSLANVRANLARIGEPIQTRKMEALKGVFNALIPAIKSIKTELGPATEQLGNMMDILSKFAVDKINALSFEGIKKLDLSGIVKALPLLLESFENIGKGVKSFITPIKDAFTEIFPPISNANEAIVNFAQSIKDVTAKFKMGDENAANLKRTFKGLFAVLDIGKQAVVAIWNAFAPLGKHISDAGGGILNFTGNIGDFLVSLNEAIKESGIFVAVMDTVSNAVSNVLGFFKTLGEAIGKMFKGSDISGLSDGLNSFGDALGKVQLKGEGFTKFITVIGDILSGVLSIVTKLAQLIGETISSLISSISEGLNNLDVLNGGLMIGILYYLKGFAFQIKSIINKTKSFLGVDLHSFLDQLTSTLFAMQEKLQAETLKELGLALLLIAGAMFVLSTIDSEKLAGVTVAVSALMAELVLALKFLSGMGTGLKGFSGILQIFNNLAMAQLAASMISFAAAILILAVAMKVLADLDWEELAKGISAVGILMLEIVGFMKLLPKGKAIKGAAGIIALSVALLILSQAVKQLGGMDFLSMLQGLGGILVMLGMIAGFSHILKPEKLISTGLAMIPMATALLIMSKAIQMLGNMDFLTMLQGLLGIAAAMATIAGFTRIVKPDQLISTGLAMIAMGAAINIMAIAIEKLGSMDLDILGKGLLSIAAILATLAGFTRIVKVDQILAVSAAMVIMGGALLIMSAAIKSLGGLDIPTLAKGLLSIIALLGAIAGFTHVVNEGELLALSGAMIVMGVAMNILALALKSLGSLSIGELVMGIAALASALIILGVAAKLLTPVIAQITALAGSVALFGLGVAAFGVGVLAIGLGLTAIGAGLASVGLGLTVLVNSVHNILPSLIGMIQQIIIDLLNMVTNTMPAFKEALTAVIEVAIDVIKEQTPRIIDAILEMLLQLMTAIDDKAPEIVDKIFSILIKFMDVLEQRMPELITRGSALLSSFFKSIFDVMNGITAESLFGVLAAVGVLVVIFKILAAAKADLKNALITAGVMMLVMLAMGGIFALLSLLDVGSVMGIAISISALLLSISASMAILSLLPIPVALSALASLGIFVAGLTVILAALGGLAQIPGLTWLIGEGAALLAQLGGAIGGFAGGIIAGITTAMSSALVSIGSDLSAFMETVQSFIDGASNIDPAAMTGVKALAEMILIISAANLIEGITSWATGGSSITKFGQMISEFAPYLVNFAEQVSGINAGDVESSANAAKALAEFASNLPKEGGFWDKIAGTSNLTKFAEELVPFGTALKRYSLTVTGLDAGVVENSANAASAISAMADNLPNQGGVLAAFTGDNNLALIAEQLVPFGKALKEYSLAVTGLDSGVVQNSVNAASALSAMAENLPDQGGLASWIAGDNTLSTFGAELVIFGKMFAQYGDAIKDVKPNVISASTTAALALAGLANTLPDQGGLKSLITGDASLSKFGSELVKFGTEFAKYSDAMSGVDSSKLIGVSNAIKMLVEIANDISNANLEGISQFVSDISDLGGLSMDAFMESFSGATERVNSVVASMIAAIVSSIKNQTGLVTSAMSDLGTQMLSKFEDKSPQVKTAATSMLAGIDEAINTKKTSLTSSINELVVSMTNALNAKKSEWTLSGGYFVDGLVIGINNNKYKSINAAIALAKETKEALDNTLGVDSPAKETMKTGKFVVMGLNKGILDNLGEITNASVTAGTKLVTSLQNYLGIHSASTVARDEVGRYFIDGVAEGIKKNTAAEEAATKKAQAIIDAFKTELEKFSLDMATADLEYSLWESLHPNASESEKSRAKADQLQKKLAMQAEKTAIAKGEYDEILKSLGADSKQTQEAYNRYLQEQINLAQMQNELDSLQKNVAKDQGAALREYAEFMNKHADMLVEQGFKLEEVRAAAAKSAGYILPGMGDTESSVEQATESLKPLLGKHVDAYVEGGHGFATAIAKGIQNGSEEPKREAENASKKGVEGVKSTEPEWNAGGGYVVTGFAKGITDNTPIASGAATTMALQSLSAAMAAIGANSPAKKFIELGKFSDMGVAAGFIKYAYLVTEASSQVGNNAIDVMKNVISRVADQVDMDMDLTPTITPVIDLTNFNKGAKAINSQFGKTSLQLANDLANEIAKSKPPKSPGDNSTNPPPVTQHFEFNQTNNSPKALSKVDIYRQTKNQFSTLKGLVSTR